MPPPSGRGPSLQPLSTNSQYVREPGYYHASLCFIARRVSGGTPSAKRSGRRFRETAFRIGLRERRDAASEPLAVPRGAAKGEIPGASRHRHSLDAERPQRRDALAAEAAARLPPD